MSRPVTFVHGPFGRVGLVDMDTDLAIHVHHHLHVVIKVGGADTRFCVRHSVCPVTDELAVLVNAWEPHAWQHAPGAPPTRFLTLYLEPDWLLAAGFRAPLEGFGGFFPATSVRLSAATRRTVQAIVEVMSATGASPTINPATGEGEGPVGAQVALLVPRLIDTLKGEARRRATATVRVGISDHRIRRALGLLRAADAPSGLEAVAREVGLSRPRFFELFQQCTGVTPARVFNASRMERAIGLLSRSRSPLADLSHDLGFATPGNFSRFFRQQIGVSPGAFRSAAIVGDPESPGVPAVRATIVRR